MPYKDKEKRAAYHKAHYKANKEKIAVQQKTYRKSEAYRKSQIDYRNSAKGKKTIAANNKDYWKRCKVEIAATKRNYRENNKEKIADSNKIYRDREGYKEKLKAYHKIYYKINKDEIADKHRIYRVKNKAKISIQSKKYSDQKENKSKVNNRIKNRYKTDPMFKLNRLMSSGIRQSLKNGKICNTWTTLVPYTPKQLKKHFEKQFQIGMSWENQGKWHIDHRIPLSVFNFTKSSHIDFKRAWSLKNLQPMWAKDNIKKSNKLEKPFQPSLLL
ncbi:MAG: hypothetical protein ABIA63_06730 [bacterium]